MWWTVALFANSARAQAQPWWDADWAWRAQLKLDNTDRVEALVDFPVLVVLEEGVNFAHGLAHPEGDDLRFVDGAAPTETLAYEIVRWNDGGASELWVKVPRIEAGELHRVWMYYGNLGVPPEQTAAGPWTGYTSVLHLEPTLADSVAAALPPTPIGTTDVDGLAGRARALNGWSERLELPDEGRFDLTGGFTVSAWFRVDFWGGDWDAIVTKGDQAFRLHRCWSTNQMGFSLNYTVGGARDQCGRDVNDGQWHFVAGVYDPVAQVQTLVVDDVVVTDAETRVLQLSDDPVWLGNNIDWTWRDLDGTIDEVRVHSVARSVGWLDAERDNLLGGLVTWCDAWTDDADLDGVCDDEEVCPGENDGFDADVDGVPDGCDVCPALAGETDADLDGIYSCDDCDDDNDAVHPGADEVPGNGLDDDCVDGDAALVDSGDTAAPESPDPTPGTTPPVTDADPDPPEGEPGDRSASEPTAEAGAIGGCGCGGGGLGGGALGLAALAALSARTTRSGSRRRR